MFELTYKNSKGEDVFTAQYLKNRGTCCKTNCLHCPYGFTLKNTPLVFNDPTLKDIVLAQKFINSAEDNSLSGALLSSAFGGSSQSVKITKFNISQYQFVILKEVTIGLLKKGKLQPEKLYLLDNFKNQGIDLDFIKSQF